MRKIRLGRTNVQVPIVSLGTWGHGGPRVTEPSASPSTSTLATICPMSRSTAVSAALYCGDAAP